MRMKFCPRWSDFQAREGNLSVGVLSFWYRRWGLAKKNHRGFVFVFAGKDGEEGRCQDARTESEAIRPKKATVVTLHCYLGTVHVQWAHASANIKTICQQ